MRKIFLLFSLLLLSISSFAQYSRYHHQRESLFEILPITNEDIVFLGNSITDGVEWSELFNNPNIKNRGINDDTAEGVLGRLSSITSGNPKKIFLMIGINDLLNGKTPQAISMVIEQVIEEIKINTPSTEIYLQSVLPANRNFSDQVMGQGAIIGLNERLQLIAQEHEIVYIDLFSHFRTGNSYSMNLEYSNDGLHLMGKGYLLWRSLIIKYLNDYNIVSQLPSLNDRNTWEAEFITSPDNSSNWYTGGSSSDTWASVVREARSNGAPPGYFGTNDGDPSPEGYRVPTVAELKAIIYELDYTKIGETIINKEENGIDIDGRGMLVNYLADYHNLTSKIIVALRFKGTSHATAFRYQWITGKGLEVVAKQAGSRISISDIASDNFDWSNSVVRCFPASAFLNNEGAYSNTGRVAPFHTANATNDRIAVALQIVNSTTSYPGRGRSFAFPIRPIKNTN